MAPLLDRQQRGVVLGAIRIGIQVRGSNGKMRPEKLSTFRLTSPDRNKVEAAAMLYGGEVASWTPLGSKRSGQWEVVTGVDVLPVRIPPGSPITQDYEMWTTTRRRLCDGFTERMGGGECQCPPDLLQRRFYAAKGEACKPTTKLSLILADLPGLGVWSLTSTGDSAADEMAHTARLLQSVEATGVMLPANLRLEQRSSGGSGELHHYVVPVLDVGATLAALETGAFTGAGVLDSGSRAALPPGLPVSPSPAGEGLTDPQAVADAASAATDPAAIRALGIFSEQRGWLGAMVLTSPDVFTELDAHLRERVAVLRQPEGNPHES